MEIFFCEKCGTRLSDIEVQRGEAVRVSDEEVYCRDCYADVAKDLPTPPPVTRATRAIRSPGKGRRRNSPGTGFALPGTEARRSRQHEESPEARARTPAGEGEGRTVLLAVVGLIVLAALVAGLVLLGGGGRRADRGLIPDEAAGSEGAEGAEGGGETGSGGGGGPGTPADAGPAGAGGELSLREQGARDMVAETRRRWLAGEISRLEAHRDLDKFFKRYPETLAASDAKKLRAEIPEPEPGAGMWYVAAGFPYVIADGIDVPHPPEEKVDIKATYSLQDGGEARWIPIEAPDATYRLTEVSRKAPAIFYCFAYLDSAAEQEATLCTNSDDGIKVWLNGEVVVSQDVQRGVEIDPDLETKVKLKKGLNPVLAKITNGGGPAAIRLYVRDNGHEVYRTTKGP